MFYSEKSYYKFVIDDALVPRTLRAIMHHYTTWPKHEIHVFLWPYKRIPVFVADDTASTLGRAFLKTEVYRSARSDSSWVRRLSIAPVAARVGHVMPHLAPSAAERAHDISHPVIDQHVIGKQNTIE